MLDYSVHVFNQKTPPLHATFKTCHCFSPSYFPLFVGCFDCSPPVTWFTRTVIFVLTGSIYVRDLVLIHTQVLRLQIMPFWNMV